jgi:uncharacterized protein YggE
MMGRTRLAGAAIAVALLAAPAGAAGPQAAIERGITVSGTASTKIVPDQADFRFGVTKQGATAVATLAAANQAAGRIVAALKANGIDAADIQTDQVSLAPRFVKGKLNGYLAANSVSVRVRALSRLATVIDAAVRAGATQVEGPSFSRSNAAELYRRLLASAIADARAKANSIAVAAGVSAAGVLEVREGSNTGGETFGKVEAAPVAGSVVEPGSQEIFASVTVTFAAG